MIDFLTTAVNSPTILQPLNTGVLTSQQLVIPINCAAPGGGVTTLAGDKRSAVAASATPPPTPAPVLTPTMCLIVAYANSGTTAIPVTGYAGSDGNGALVFPASNTGVNYLLGTNYTFYIAIATVTTPTPGPTATPKPSPAPSSSPSHGGSCDEDNHDGHHGDSHDGDKHDSHSHSSDNHGDDGHGDGHDGHDNGNHKDCGEHNGDGHDHHDSHGDGHDGHDN